MTGARLVLCLFVLALPSAPALAQSSSGPLSDYTISTWNESGGLPAGRIRALAQDAEGLLWLATDAGLVRFDGVRFDKISAFGDTRLPTGAFTALLIARDRSLWVGMSGRAAIGRIVDGKVTLYDERDGFASTYVLSMLEERDGTIWAGTVHGLFRLVGRRWQKADEADGVGAGPVLALHEDHEGRVWLATSRAVFRKARNSQRFEQVDDIPISSNVWASFSEDPAGTIWMSDFMEGLRTPGRPRTAKSPVARRGWGVELLHDRRGNFWVGTQGQGLWRIRSDRHGRSITDAATVEHGLASNAVQSLLEDREGNIWLGTLAGLQRLAPHRVTPLKNLPIPRAIEVTPDGSVWIGTAFGLVRFSQSGRRHYTEADGLNGSVILALQTDRRGDLWISTERGITRFSQGRFSPLVLPATGNMQRVVGIAGSGDTLWLRDFYFRIQRLQNGQLKPADDLPASHRKSATAVYSGKSGDLWIGSTGGRVGVRSVDGKFRTYELGIGMVACFFEDSRGTVWVGGDEGLGHIENGHITNISRQNGLAGGVKSVVEDDMGFVWVGADAGILRLEPHEATKVAADPQYQIRYRLFNAADGAAGIPFGEGTPTSKRAHDGRLWFVSSSGVTIVDPRTLGVVTPSPAARIESVTADTRPLDPRGSLDLPARTSHVQIAFTALTLSDSTRVRFRYRLEGFDRDWVDAGGARQATYTNLPPRGYRFQVMASAGDGTWGEPSAALDFGIRPMFYQRLWFLLACAAAGFLLVYASWRLHVRQVRRQFALVLAERIRMSRAIHDTLLQGLAALALQVDDLSHNPDISSPAGKGRILGIRRQVEEYIRQARRSILDLRSPTLASRDLSQALREVAERAIGGREVALDLTVNGTPHPYAPSVEEHLLLIGQEAVNNAVNHGQPRHVAVELDYDDDRMRLRVTDDGCGFDPDSARTAAVGHFGLISMRERAEQVRGRLKISSTPGGGTQVETVVPT